MGTVPDAMTTGLDRLFEHHGDRIFAFLLHRCGSRPVAEDLTTETFMAAGRHQAQNRGHEVTEAWLVTVARRRLIDHWRRETRERRRTERLVTEIRRAAAPQPTFTRVDEALESLSAEHRAALVLRYLEGFSVSEVADALDRSYKATESMLSRARRAFSRAYESGSC